MSQVVSPANSTRSTAVQIPAGNEKAEFDILKQIELEGTEPDRLHTTQGGTLLTEDGFDILLEDA